MKQGIIDGVYHVQLSKEEVEALKEVVIMTLPILRVRQPESLYKKLIKTLENLVPKITP